MAAGPTAPDASRGGAALAVEGLSHAYGDSWALRGVSLGVGPGTTLAVIGANGAGKSTLLRILGTLLRPTEGRVEVLGCPLPEAAWRLRGRLGYLGHQALLYRDLTALENLRFHARLFGLGAGSERRISDLLETVGLDHRAGTRIAEMSAGMLQRLAICRAVLHEPELLLLDEPLAHLDPEGAATVRPLIGPGQGRTRILVTHDVATALADADRVLALGPGGTVAYEGPTAGLNERSARSVYGEAVAAAGAGAGR